LGQIVSQYLPTTYYIGDAGDAGVLEIRSSIAIFILVIEDAESRVTRDRPIVWKERKAESCFIW